MKTYLIIILILIILASAFLLLENLGSKEKAIFQIKRGQGLREISLNLRGRGFINWSPIFKGYVLIRGVARKLKTGCYFLSPSMDIPQIAEILSSGAIAKKMVTIPEGFTAAQIIERLTRTFPVNLTGNVLVNWEKHEGYLFPDTYEIPYCQEQEKIIETMTANFNKKTAGLKITPEAVVMASLLEKELRTKEDKEIASGILWKRLKTKIPLQVDAAMWTYENYGLPAKPISNPGLETILTALYPKESPYWYYLSTPEGTTIFSKTLEEHNIAKVKYLTP